MEGIIGFGILCLILGIGIGTSVCDSKWIHNSRSCCRLLIKGRFYKVTDINNTDSWRFTMMHNLTENIKKEKG